MRMPDSIVVRLGVEVDPQSEKVYLTHPALKGNLSFVYGTPGMAEMQIESVRLDKSKSALEEVIENTNSLIQLSGELRRQIQELQKPT